MEMTLTHGDQSRAGRAQKPGAVLWRLQNLTSSYDVRSLSGDLGPSRPLCVVMSPRDAAHRGSGAGLLITMRLIFALALALVVEGNGYAQGSFIPVLQLRAGQTVADTVLETTEGEDESA